MATSTDTSIHVHDIETGRSAKAGPLMSAFTAYKRLSKEASNMDFRKQSKKNKKRRSSLSDTGSASKLPFKKKKMATADIGAHAMGKRKSLIKRLRKSKKTKHQIEDSPCQFQEDTTQACDEDQRKSPSYDIINSSTDFNDTKEETAEGEITMDADESVHKEEEGKDTFASDFNDTKEDMADASTIDKEEEEKDSDSNDSNDDVHKEEEEENHTKGEVIDNKANFEFDQDHSEQQHFLACDGNNISQFSTPFRNLFNLGAHEDSRRAGRALLELMLRPVTLDHFFKDVWERKPLFLKRGESTYNSGWFDMKELNHVMQTHRLEYSINVNLTTYEDGKRETHNPHGRVWPEVVWHHYKEGCSVQLLNPQTYSDSMWLLLATLREYLNSFVGANIYLTPPGTQGFAPHYDDIDAFVLQVEGKKLWKLYKPRNYSEILPRYSSENFTEDEIGEPVLEVMLEPGDLLYFPRGTIHQATALPDTHSLHITVSAAQTNTWGDLLEKIMPVALERAIKEEDEFRKNLPIDYLDYMGVVHNDKEDPRKREFLDKVNSLMERLMEHAPVDAGVDQMGVELLHCSLPPYLTQEEKCNSIWRQDPVLKAGEIAPGISIMLESRVKLIRRGAVQLAVEDSNGPTLYFSTGNTRVYKESELQKLLLEPEEGVCIEELINAYPQYVSPKDLVTEEASEELVVELCYKLYDHGLLIVQDSNTSSPEIPSYKC